MLFTLALYTSVHTSKALITRGGPGCEPAAQAAFEAGACPALNALLSKHPEVSELRDEARPLLLSIGDQMVAIDRKAAAKGAKGGGKAGATAEVQAGGGGRARRRGGGAQEVVVATYLY